jgi:hypothetical protein
VQPSVQPTVQPLPVPTPAPVRLCLPLPPPPPQEQKQPEPQLRLGDRLFDFIDGQNDRSKVGVQQLPL